jgi:hypothetical protein
MNTTNLIDPATVRKFLAVVHERAAAATAHVDRPSVLHLVARAPDDRGMSCSAFLVGDIEHMLEAALIDAEAHRNVFIEPRTVRPGRPDERGRGKIESTIAVFAFGIDHDADTGKAGTINDESVLIGTSPGNHQEWLFLDRAMDAGDAKPLPENDANNRCGSAATARSRLPVQPSKTV